MKLSLSEKSGRKRIAFFAVMIMTVLFSFIASSCAPENEDLYRKYRLAYAKTLDAGSLSANYVLSMKLFNRGFNDRPEAEVTLISAFRARNINDRDALTAQEVVKYVVQLYGASKSSAEEDMFHSAGNTYVRYRSAFEKENKFRKEQPDKISELSCIHSFAISDVNTLLVFGKNEFKNASRINGEDGEVTIVFTPDDDEVKRIISGALNKYYLSPGAMKSEVRFMNLRDLEYKLTISSDGYIKSVGFSGNVIIELYANSKLTAFSADLRLSVTFSRFGEEVSFDFRPDQD